MDRVTKKLPKRKCKICGEMFQVTLVRRNELSTATLCSPECRAESRRNTVRWTQSELEYIKDHANDLPFVLFYAQFCREQKIHGWPPRTKVAFRDKLKDLGITAVGLYVVVAQRNLARMLGVSKAAVRNMIRDGLSISHRCPRTKIQYVSLKSVRQYAAKKPERFGGLDYHNLLSVIDDDELCREILEKHPNRFCDVTKPQRVLCLDTNRCFKSIRQAALANYVHPDSVRRSILEKRPSCGLTFKFYP